MHCECDLAYHAIPWASRATLNPCVGQGGSYVLVIGGQGAMGSRCLETREKCLYRTLCMCNTHLL